MVFQKGEQRQSQPKPKEKENCVVDVRKTKNGKRITFKGHCSRSELELAKNSDSFDD